MTQHEQSLVAENAALREENEALKAGRCLHQISEPDAEIQSAWRAGIDEGRAQMATNAQAAVDAPVAAMLPAQQTQGGSK